MRRKCLEINILKYRRLRGFTQEQLAEKSGVSRARISDIEHGKVSCNIETIYLFIGGSIRYRL